MIPDRHVHTCFSTDSKERPENVLEKAIAAGMKDIYITDHYDIDFPGDEFRFDPDSYFEAMLPLKDRYKDRIDLHIGVEISINEEISAQVDELLESYPWEYVIGSTHIVDGKDPYLRELFDMDDEAFYRLCLETSLKGIMSCRGFDTFGHLDFALRYGYTKDRDYRYEKYADITDEILKELIKRNIALEVNTAAVRKGLKYFHPYPEVLKRYKELGGRKLAAGSDAHTAADVGYGFDRIAEYVSAAGFSESDFI